MTRVAPPSATSRNWPPTARWPKRSGPTLDPATTHVYLCGNPAMIGLPEWEGDEPRFPETVGMCQILHEMGFTIDRRGVKGNVHYEEYW